MTAYDTHLAALRHEAAGLLAAVSREPATAVPTCPGWTLDDLATHVARGFVRVTRIVRDHADAEVSFEGIAAPDDSPAAWLDAATAELVEALTNEAPDTRVWNWSGQDETVAFWARRMAHETAVHRWDAESAHGTPTPVDADLAEDGVDEALNVFLPYSLARGPVDDLEGTFAVRTTDTGAAWFGRLRPDSSDVTRGTPASLPGALLRGTASDLLLVLWGRPAPVETSGDERVVALLTA